MLKEFNDISKDTGPFPAAGQARWLICTLTAFLSGAGFTHVVFTAVPRLYNAFRRMGLPLLKHADARPECLPAAQVREWDSYYSSRPAVYSGDIRVGEKSRHFEPAIELYTGEDTFGIGPALLGSHPLGGGRQIRWEAGLIFGVDSDTPDQVFRGLLEFEF